jgi:hypothetical protein
MRRAHVWYFAVDATSCAWRPGVCIGIGSSAFEARDDAARYYGIDPAELVLLAFDTRVTR